jgi:hypothetical protein
MNSATRFARRGAIALTVVGLLGGSSPRLAAQPVVKTTYRPSNDLFPNPERGFFASWEYNQRPNRPSPPAPALDALRAVRDKGMSIAHLNYMMPQFRESALSPEFLARVASDLALVRDAGLKCIPRFAYNSGPIGAQDASLERMIGHLDQLKPVFQANADVIAFVEAGFAGAWGEWHSSTNGFFENVPGSGGGTNITANTRALVAKMLEVLPPDRMIALRCPRFKIQLTGDQPLTAQEAFAPTTKARMGAHNDCLLATRDDMGTYTRAGMDQEKEFLHRDNLFVPQGGETCSVQPAAQPFIGCENALKELAYLRYSVLNSAYHRGVLEGWEKGGCMVEIQRRMGYRFRLAEASLPESVKRRGEFRMTFTVANDGWANLYNPRPVEVVLRNTATHQESRLQVKTDPRLWMPGESTVVNMSAALPPTMTAGTYQVLLQLPDAAPGLKGRPEYSIRFANPDVWEAATGMNSLQRTIKIQ